MREKIIPAVPERVVKEMVASISVSYLHQTASVGLIEGTLVGGAFTPSPNTLRHTDIGFEELMSANPLWAPNKPEGNFRLEDIFALLDYKEEL